MAFNANVFADQILWTQYCQHQGTMKLLVHLDTDPTEPMNVNPQQVQLWLRGQAEDEWTLADSQPVDHLTATALFVRQDWPRTSRILFKVTCGEYSSEGIFRAEPENHAV